MADCLRRCLKFGIGVLGTTGKFVLVAADVKQVASDHQFRQPFGRRRHSDMDVDTDVARDGRDGADDLDAEPAEHDVDHTAAESTDDPLLSRSERLLDRLRASVLGLPRWLLPVRANALSIARSSEPLTWATPLTTTWGV